MVEESPSLDCVVSDDHRIITTLAYSAVCLLLGNGQDREKQTVKSWHPIIACFLQKRFLDQG